MSQAFLHSDLDERFNIYIEVPAGFSGPNGERFAKLHKSRYGLKQASFDYYQLQRKFLLKVDQRMRQSVTEPCLFYINEPGLCFMLVSWVDDYYVICNDDAFYKEFLRKMKKEFDVNDLGTPKHVLQAMVVQKNKHTT